MTTSPLLVVADITVTTENRLSRVALDRQSPLTNYWLIHPEKAEGEIKASENAISIWSERSRGLPYPTIQLVADTMRDIKRLSEEIAELEKTIG